MMLVLIKFTLLNINFMNINENFFITILITIALTMMSSTIVGDLLKIHLLTSIGHLLAKLMFVVWLLVMSAALLVIISEKVYKLINKK
jgi:CBS domain containing-hemolysin-like protein